jgi:hypothetical protein
MATAAEIATSTVLFIINNQFYSNPQFKRKFSMRTIKILLGILVFVCFMSMIAETAMAQADHVITFDENGNGTFLGETLRWDIRSDPGPGGFPLTLTYLPQFMDTTGDLLIMEPTGALSDVVRFYHGGIDNPSRIVFYSDLPESTLVELPDLADVGLPGAYYPNRVEMVEQGTEGNNWVDYTPIQGQPGYL